jgi:cytochrome c oxidase subunit 2
MTAPERWLRRLLYLPEQASSVAREIDLLHFLIIGTTFLGALLVALSVLWFVVRYRARGPRTGLPARRSTRRFELALSAFVLGLFVFFWVLGFRQFRALRAAPRESLDVYVVAKQWVWKFSHASGVEELETLTVPVGVPVRLVMTSRDVIHSFYVPAFRIKQDVLPGRYVSAWFEAVKPGRYDILCAEFCGLSHSNMRGTVVVLERDAYDRWLRGFDPAPERSIAALGERVAARKQCTACHTADGRRHVGPTWRGLFGSWVELEGGRRVLADEEYLTRSMMDPAVDRVAGYRAVMPTYQGSLSSGEVAALLFYIKTLRAPPDPAIAALPELGADSTARAEVPAPEATP